MFCARNNSTRSRAKVDKQTGEEGGLSDKMYQCHVELWRSNIFPKPGWDVWQQIIASERWECFEKQSSNSKAFALARRKKKRRILMIKVYVSSGKSEAALEGLTFCWCRGWKASLWAYLFMDWLVSVKTLRRSFRLLKSLSAQLSDKVADFKGAPLRH